MSQHLNIILTRLAWMINDLKTVTHSKEWNDKHVNAIRQLLPERVSTITSDWTSVVIMYTYDMAAVRLGTPANQSVTLQHKTNITVTH